MLSSALFTSDWPSRRDLCVNAVCRNFKYCLDVYTELARLLIARALEGLLLGGVPAVTMAWIAEEIAPEHLGKTMGLYIAGTAFGGMMGRVGMGILVEYFHGAPPRPTWSNLFYLLNCIFKTTAYFRVILCRKKG